MKKETLYRLIEEVIAEDPCWDNYEMVGMKQKNGKEVPNCVPKMDEDEKKPCKPSKGQRFAKRVDG